MPAAANIHVSAVERVHTAMREFGAAHPSLLILASSMNDRVQAIDTVSDMTLSESGRLLVNPRFAVRVSRRVLAGSAFHVLLHPALRHGARRAGREPSTWWIACDMVVNEALLRAKLGVPSHAVRVPLRYDGDHQVEGLFEWLRRRSPRPNTSQIPRSSGGRGERRDQGPRNIRTSLESGGSAGREVAHDRQSGVGQGGEHRSGPIRRVGAGCGVDVPPALEVAFADIIKGTTGGLPGAAYQLEQLMLDVGTVKPRVDWRRVLHGLMSTSRGHGYSRVMWARPNYRREISPNVILPTWRDQDFRLGIVVDVSGSMPRCAIQLVVAEARSIMRAYPRVRVWLAAHTDKTCFAEWVHRLDDAVVRAALSFTGGTDPTSTYESARNAGRLDALLHFTDRLFVGAWPRVPRGARLIVGEFENSWMEKAEPPPGSVVIPCTQPGEEVPGG